jgi:hypothetical protein
LLGDSQFAKIAKWGIFSSDVRPIEAEKNEVGGASRWGVMPAGSMPKWPVG